MSETKFVIGEIVVCQTCNKYREASTGSKGEVTDVYRSKESDEVIYEVQFEKALVLTREYDLVAA